MGKCKIKATEAGVGIFKHIPAYSGIFKHNQEYLGFIQTYSCTFRTLRNPSIFRNPGIFTFIDILITLAYSKP